MSTLLALVVLCGMSVSVLADGEAMNCIFDFGFFTPHGNSENNVVDYSGQQISTLTEGSKTYHYVTGPLDVKSVVDSSYLVYYIIQKHSDGGVENIALGLRDACYFQENIYSKYLLPIAGMHNNFPPEASVCPIKPFTADINKVQVSVELLAPSQLDEGDYYFEIAFTKNLRPVGGTMGNFTVLRGRDMLGDGGFLSL